MPTVNTLNLTDLEYPSQPLILPLPLQRPLLMIGHGTKDQEGQQSFLDFAVTDLTGLMSCLDSRVLNILLSACC